MNKSLFKAASAVISKKLIAQRRAQLKAAESVNKKG
jgi:hypothetical protein